MNQIELVAEVVEIESKEGAEELSLLDMDFVGGGSVSLSLL